MNPYSQELRLLWFVGLNALVLTAVARVALAFSGRRRCWFLLDVLLLNYVVEYALVCGLGVFGLLTLFNLTLATVTVSAGMVAFAYSVTKETSIESSGLLLRGKSLALFILLFAVAFELCYLVYSRDLPVLETDALAYHLPVAMEWLRTGRLGILQTWYWNPTNTYSPMGAEAFIAWLIAPMGSDFFARFVQAPAWIMLLLSMYRIARTLGATATIAACVAAGTVLSRSMFSQASVLKDDLFVAAFLLVAIAALADVAEAKRVGDRLAPWRVGCAIGLLLAMKYPALIAVPVLLLVIVPSLRIWTRTQKMIAITIVSVLAGPWFLRNAVHFGNPLYPIIIKFLGYPVFHGLFKTAPDPAMRTPRGFWHMMVGGYFGTPGPLLIAVTVLWAIGLFGVHRLNPLRFFAGLGAMVGVIFFAIASPYPEVRYFLPFELLFYAGVTQGLIVLGRWPVVQGIAACAFVVGATCTTFEIAHADFVAQFSLEAAILAAAGLGYVALWQRRRRLAISMLAIILIVGVGISYVQFDAYADSVNDNADAIWSSPDTYGSLGEAWVFVRHRLPPAATVAYANTNLIEPLYGSRSARRLVFAPVRPGLHTLADLPPLGEQVPQDRIFQTTTRAINQNADLATWVENLRNSRADFLFLAKHGSSEHAPEEGFIANLKWKPIFENDAAAVYQVNGAMH